ncbi:hypothetical protein SAMN05421803_10460 [Nocardiopsis flavescens]|uniref:Thioesterase family protein n=1 Tax=Nocardiopsis flavescens TaxID=758803 RepID=A0A1M6H734_9ACTN|nr:hypothetical protein [Nocardiopsis flavescens]SHJ17974.1 hypothetical protein SAMN05421803_10460 [Nocardiopsis flavescens]
MHATPGNDAPSLTVPATRNGPDGSGNGGYTAGLLASRLTAVGGPAVQVTLRVPPPLGRPLTVEGGAGEPLRLVDPSAADAAARLVAEAEEVAVPAAPAVPGAPVGPEQARDAERRFAGLEAHPFPRCYSCGPERAQGEGLRLFAGRVRAGGGPDGAGNTVACTWTPHPGLDEGAGTVGAPDLWAALDCPGGWSSDVVGRPAVLGRITVQALRAPRIGETHVVAGYLESVEGRKIRTGSALYDADGDVLARAWATWIALRT